MIFFFLIRFGVIERKKWKKCDLSTRIRIFIVRPRVINANSIHCILLLYSNNNNKKQYDQNGIVVIRLSYDYRRAEPMNHKNKLKGKKGVIKKKKNP